MMKRFAIWSPILVVAAVVVVAAAPSKKSSTTVSTPVENAVPQPAAIAPSNSDVSTDASTPAIMAPIPENPQPATSNMANYAIDWYSINGGGTVNATSTNYKMGASIGQSVAGAASSTNYQMGIGFWYGAGGACACNCHARPADCTGAQDVLDVVSTVNVAFRGAAAILDPNPNCPWQTTDTDCDGFTTIVDVVHMVNVAFRAGNPATEFCVPCP